MHRNLTVCIIILLGNIVNFFAENVHDHVPADAIMQERVDSVPSTDEIVYFTPRDTLKDSLVMNYGYWTEPPVDGNKCKVELKKRPLLAAGQVFAINMGVWAFDRFILDGDYAYINFHTMKQNLRTGFVWDNDNFSTNLFFHPYHGSLYFNAARSNRLNFWQSAPYSIGGSLMWELFMENEPPAINDWIATSLGGSCLGEITWRISDLFVDQSARGMERVAREAAILVISPMRGLNRLLFGDTWKHSSCAGRTIDRPELVFSTSLDFRYLAERSNWEEGVKGAQVGLNLVYGNPMNDFDGTPYSFFVLDAKFNFMSGQPFVGGVSAKALLWGTHLKSKPDAGLLLGVFQHFNFQDSNPIKSGDTETEPYQISEAASFGGGMICSVPIVSQQLYFFSDVYINGVLLGGNHTDYYRVIDRDYNMGSGYSFKILPGISWRNVVFLRLGVDRIQLYTWKGYKKGLDLSRLSHEEMIYLNVQGDRGNTALTTITAEMAVQLYENLELNLSQAYYLRRSEYAHFPDVSYEAVESKIGLLYRFK
jgi:hypothetical protein